MKFTDVRFQSASDDDRRRGLLGWIALTIDDTLYLDGLTLRRTADDRLVVSFPARRDGAGREHHYIRPVDDHARRDIERRVFLALGIEEGAR